MLAPAAICAAGMPPGELTFLMEAPGAAPRAGETHDVSAQVSGNRLRRRGGIAKCACRARGMVKQ